MPRGILTRATTPAHLLLLLGVLAVAAAGWVVHRRGASAAASEEQAMVLCRLVLKAARARGPVDLGDARAAQALAATVSRRAAVELVPVPVPEPQRGRLLLLRTATHLFALSRAPIDDRTAAAAARGSAWEVLAWPAAGASPGHAAFYLAEDLPLAHSRNLHADYVGLEAGAIPEPGSGRPQDPERSGQDAAYRGRDHERWLPVQRRTRLIVGYD